MELMLKSKIDGLIVKFLWSPLSKPVIPLYIKMNKISMKDFQGQKYRTFREFFVREREPVEMDLNPGHLISPCDGWLSAFPIEEDSSFRIKGSHYKLEDLIQDKELAKTATDLDSRFRNGERIVSLPGQVQFSPLSLSSTDMQFLETRKFSVRDICRFFGVHPSFVFDDTSNNYKSAEMANVAFLSNTLNPLLRKIEVELHRKLVAPSLCCKRRFQFDRRGLYACDLDSRIKYQAQTIAAGIYTVNDWRKEENKPAVEGGDTVLVSANLKGINESSATAAPAGNNKPVEPAQDPKENEE